MFYDRWSTKVTLPLGAKWGNNIGGVAACLNWSGGRGAKPPLPKSEFSTLQYNNHHHKPPTPRKNGYKSGSQPKNVYYASDFTNPPNDYYYDGRSDDKYISIIPWQEDLGLARGADGKLKIAKTEPLGGYYDSHPGEGTHRSGVTARPSTGGQRYGGRTVRAATPKGYGFMGPPPTPPRRPGTSTAFRRSTRPVNPTPTPRRDNPSSTSRQEVYKYTERELIVEDLDNGNDVTTGRASRSQSRAGGSGSRAGYPTGRDNAYADVWRPNTGTGRRDYQLPVDRDEFSPTPLVWQSREFDNPIPPAKILSTRSKSFSTRPKTASGSLSKDVRVNVGSMGHRTVEDTVKLSDYHTHRAPSTSRSPAENVTIHVDCSKLVNSTRPASLTVRLHGVDSNDAENIKINTTPFK